MTTELDPSLQQRIVKLAEAYPARWEEVLDGRTEARSWFLGMTAFGLDEQIDRKAVQAYIDDQVGMIRDLDALDAKGRKTWAHHRLPVLRHACGVPEAAPVEDVMAKAAVEGQDIESNPSIPSVVYEMGAFREMLAEVIDKASAIGADNYNDEPAGGWGRVTDEIIQQALDGTLDQELPPELEDYQAPDPVVRPRSEVLGHTFRGVDSETGEVIISDGVMNAPILVGSPKVLNLTATTFMSDGSATVMTIPNCTVTPDGEGGMRDDEGEGTIDMKGPPLDPYLAISKTKLTELLEDAWSHGNSCEGDRYGHVSGFKEEDVSKLVEKSFSASDNGATRLEDMTPEQRKHVAGMTHAYISADSAEAIAKLDPMDLRPGGLFELPPTYGVVYFEHLLRDADMDEGRS